MESIKLDSRTQYIIFGTLGAFFLSIMVGLFSKNPFGIVFMRAVVSSLIFGLILFGASQLIQRFIPELLTLQKGEDKSTVKHKRTEVTGDFSIPGEERFKRFEKSGETAPDTAFSPAADIPGEDLRFPEGGPVEEQAEEDGLPSFENLIDEDEMLPDEHFGEETERNSALKGDYINVGNMKFPNEPETLAKVVKRVMSQDQYE